MEPLPSYIFIGGSHGAFGRGLLLYPLEPTLGANEEMPRIKDEAVGPKARSADLAGRPVCPGLQPPPNLIFRLSWCPLS